MVGAGEGAGVVAGVGVSTFAGTGVVTFGFLQPDPDIRKANMMIPAAASMYGDLLIASLSFFSYLGFLKLDQEQRSRKPYHAYRIQYITLCKT
jgi:hypothetical protein